MSLRDKWAAYTKAVEARTNKWTDATDAKAEHQRRKLADTPTFAELSVGFAAERGFNGAQVRNGTLHYHGHTYPMHGIQAEVEVGATSRRMTATRIAAGTIISPGIGTIIGGAARKATQHVYVNILISDGRIIVIQTDANKETAARKFAHSVTHHPSANL